MHYIENNIHIIDKKKLPQMRTFTTYVLMVLLVCFSCTTDEAAFDTPESEAYFADIAKTLIIDQSDAKSDLSMRSAEENNGVFGGDLGVERGSRIVCGQERSDTGHKRHAVWNHRRLQDQLA